MTQHDNQRTNWWQEWGSNGPQHLHGSKTPAFTNTNETNRKPHPPMYPVTPSWASSCSHWSQMDVWRISWLAKKAQINPKQVHAHSSCIFQWGPFHCPLVWPLGRVVELRWPWVLWLPSHQCDKCQVQPPLVWWASDEFSHIFIWTWYTRWENSLVDLTCIDFIFSTAFHYFTTIWTFLVTLLSFLPECLN